MSSHPPTSIDRSQDPQNEATTRCYFGSYCQENNEGSGWNVPIDYKRFVPRGPIEKGDVVGMEPTYQVDLSFGSCGTDSSDVSDSTNVWFGYPHNALYGHAIDGNLAEVKKCLESGSNINEKLKIGDQWTALDGAVIYNQLEVVEYLLKQGADYTITDTRGRSSVTLASVFCMTQCAVLMKKHVSADYLQNQYSVELKASDDKLAEERSKIYRSYGIN